jgi:hypothetical protein
LRAHPEADHEGSDESHKAHREVQSDGPPGRVVEDSFEDRQAELGAAQADETSQGTDRGTVEEGEKTTSGWFWGHREAVYDDSMRSPHPPRGSFTPWATRFRRACRSSEPCRRNKDLRTGPQFSLMFLPASCVGQVGSAYSIDSRIS